MTRGSLSGITAYIDGACSGNPGPGGWGVVVVTPSGTREFSGSDPATTNNRMELSAFVRVLEYLSPDVGVTIYADSQYVVKGVNEWMAGWIRNGWRTAQKKPVENVDLWKRVETLMANRIAGITHVKWVKGHAGHPMNERADALAVAARQAGVHGTSATAVAPRIAQAVIPPLTFVRRRQSDVPNPAVPGIERLVVMVQTETCTGMLTIEILSNAAGPYAEVRATDGDLAALLAARPVLEGLAEAARQSGRGLDGNAVEAVLMAAGAHDMTSDATGA